MSNEHNTAARVKRGAGRSALRIAVGAPIAAALGWIAYSNLFIPRDLPLPPAVSGERVEFEGRAGQVSYYVAGSGEPLLLIHSINAAASAYEVRPIFEHYRESRRVYALDLPGFGFSERSPRHYTPRLYTDAIHDMLDRIATDTGARSIDALAVSLGSEFLARAASEAPERFKSVALITPTGLRQNDRFDGPPGSTREVALVRSIISFPLWGRPFFDLLNTRVSQRFFLGQTFGSVEEIDQGLLEYDYLAAHQPGAEHAPFAFLSGAVFSGDIHRVYDSLTMPVWLGYGTRGEFGDVSLSQPVTQKPNWWIDSFATGALPYFQEPDEFFTAYDAFLEQASREPTHQAAVGSVAE